MNNMTTLPPSQTFPLLFKKVHELRIFEDAKTMSDVVPLFDSKRINSAFLALNDHSKESISNFLNHHFTVPITKESDFKTNTDHTLKKHIETLWKVLRREKDQPIEGSSLVPLPHPYIVPGGRFNEIYYWDSYFTMLGLRESGHVDLIENMINNFAHQIDQFGHIPNGNRTYFLSRSQPPFFALMVELLADIKGEEIILTYLPQLEKEYEFWMNGRELLSKEMPVINRVLMTSHGHILNRYYDALDTPRDEMYPDDVELAEKVDRNENELFRHLRAACESGWDFSSRWFSDGQNLSTIEATNIVPVDLNCLLYQLEKTIAKGLKLKGNHSEADGFTEMAAKRKEAINDTFWNEKLDYYFDYHFIDSDFTNIVSSAGVFPLFFEICIDKNALRVAEIIERQLLKSGGLLSTDCHTGQQWDAPNGWAPLQYMAIKGLLNYNQADLALQIAERWTSLNESVFKSTGKMLEKYNVEDISLYAGGGEYPVQDGFGWTNGVYLALKNLMPRVKM